MMRQKDISSRCFQGMENRVYDQALGSDVVAKGMVQW